MKNKLITIFALIFAMGAFSFPINALADEGGAPPSIDASITGTTLRIETAGGDHDVEAVFINDIRFDYREGGVMNFDVRDFADIGELIIIYAMDVEGNMSDVLLHVVPIPQPIFPPDPPLPEPPPPPQSIPLTPRGQASVLDHATDEDGKEFFTFVTPAGNVFFLIVDHQRESDNVYFLNAVTEADLMALAEQEGITIDMGESAIPVTPPSQPNTSGTDGGETEDAEDDEEPPAGGGVNGTLIFVLLGVLALGGTGYYIKIVRPKQQAQDYDDEYGEGGGDDDTDEMVFEDDQAERNAEDDEEMEDEDE